MKVGYYCDEHLRKKLILLVIGNHEILPCIETECNYACCDKEATCRLFYESDE